MGLDPSSIIVATNHHRYQPCFRDTLRRLWDGGFRRIWVQETGDGSWGWYAGPSEWVRRVGSISYDTGMIRFKEVIHPGVEAGAIFFIDCDCLISGMEELLAFVADFDRGGYAYSCHHPSIEAYSPNYVYDGCIAPVVDQKFIPSPGQYGFYPEPHWENTYALVRKDIWDKLGPDDVSNTRVWFRAMHRLGGKFGAHRASYRLQYSHLGDSWFHFGNLMAFLYAIEREDHGRFDVSSEIAMSRLGFLQWQEQKYGAQAYPVAIRDKLHRILSSGDRAKLADGAWGRLMAGTCLERWERYSP